MVTVAIATFIIFQQSFFLSIKQVKKDDSDRELLIHKIELLDGSLAAIINEYMSPMMTKHMRHFLIILMIRTTLIQLRAKWNKNKIVKRVPLLYLVGTNRSTLELV